MKWDPRYWFYRGHARELFRRIDRCLVVSKDLGQRLLEVGAPPDKVMIFQRGLCYRSSSWSFG